ncbi:hypothetical protein [Vibrio sp. D431a]|uniref:hypothetical protein n=1 Tax=Vibrio sp. D431a TaxID=2837388 RepID=UPI00255796A4|nr:hypothetical protein [Vibrio sp. D431a]MDK9790108.1 hypothetical protein [Vibrio sp. D431a]
MSVNNVGKPSKVHYYNHVATAWNLMLEGNVDRETASNQTACGYIRSQVSSNKLDVTCKKCLHVMKQQGILV